jgi:hypothetical protein
MRRRNAALLLLVLVACVRAAGARPIGKIVGAEPDWR